MEKPWGRKKCGIFKKLGEGQCDTYHKDFRRNGTGWCWWDTQWTNHESLVEYIEDLNFTFRAMGKELFKQGCETWSDLLVKASLWQSMEHTWRRKDKWERTGQMLLQESSRETLAPLYSNDRGNKRPGHTEEILRRSNQCDLVMNWLSGVKNKACPVWPRVFG